MFLIDLLRESGDTPVVLLHCYPFEREAGYLASAFNNVHLDVGLSVNHLGARPGPSSPGPSNWPRSARSWYSSDAFWAAGVALPGCTAVARRNGFGSRRFRRPGEWSADDALRVAGLIGRGNATRVYGI